jgi:hypothetical protein
MTFHEALNNHLCLDTAELRGDSHACVTHKENMDVQFQRVDSKKRVVLSGYFCLKQISGLKLSC